MKLTDALEQLGYPVAYYPRLSKPLGGCKVAILVCQLFYWTTRSTDNDKWVYRTANELETDTGLSYEEQRSARKQLGKLGILEEDYKRLEHRLCFRLDLVRLNEVWRNWYKANFANPAKPVSRNGQSPDGEPDKAHFDNIRSRESKKEIKKREIVDREEEDGALRPSSLIIGQHKKDGDVKGQKDSIGFDVHGAPTAQKSTEASGWLLPAPRGEAPTITPDPHPTPVIEPGQNPVSEHCKALADCSPSEIVGLFNATVEEQKPRAITCCYRDWDDKYIPAILDRFKDSQSFASAVASYAKILVPSRRATLRDFLASAPPTLSPATRPQESNRGAKATPPAEPKRLGKRQVFDAVATGMGLDPSKLKEPLRCSVGYSLLPTFFQSLDFAAHCGRLYAAEFPGVSLDEDEFIEWYCKKKNSGYQFMEASTVEPVAS